MPFHLRDLARMAGARLGDVFERVADRVSSVLGSPAGFITALLIVLLWAVTGPTFGFSNTWQLVINTGTTIVTFLMMFLVTNNQNRQEARLEKIIGHLDKLATFDHEEHGRLLRELYAHVTCEGHTTIGLTIGDALMAPHDAAQTMDDPPAAKTRQISTTRTLRAMMPKTGKSTPNA
ncbi:MAG TPA: low affinity iron permease family protein [Ktedonobacterales bacterium]|nr:low affinity iron permease family protein [Ktedonobacterales bacterium]